MIDVAIDARITRRTSAGTRAYVEALLERLPRVAPDVRLHPVGSGSGLDLAEQFDLPIEIERLAPALTHFPQISVPLRRPGPYVATVHDLIHLQYPQFFSPLTAGYYALVASPMFRAARLLVMGDARTVTACGRYLGVAPERCRVVPLGYDPALLDPPPQPLRPPRPFFLYAGNHRPHKNLRVLYAAWAALPAAADVDLLVTGPDDPAVRAAYVRPHGELRFLGNLSVAELRRHYRAALAYVHPALVEGFGIPMLEALAVGTPVVASQTALPGILAGQARTFPAHDELALRAVLTDLVADPAPFRRQAAEGSAVARAYTWDRFAAATAAVYREVADGSRGA